MKAHFPGGKQKVAELVVWEKRLKDLLGFKMKDFVTYVRQEHSKRRDAFVLRLTELPLLLCRWSIAAQEK